MEDVETGTLWSHLLGKAMKGELQGESLQPLPSDMITWHAWLRRHPNTTLLDLSRTSRDFTRATHAQLQDRNQLLLGFSVKHSMFHCSFVTMARQPVVQFEAKGIPLLILHDPKSASARIYKRTLEGTTLSFVATENSQLRDTQTHSTWDPHTGTATSGPHDGQRLEPLVGIVSYTNAWRIFHPDSQPIPAGE